MNRGSIYDEIGWMLGDPNHTRWPTSTLYTRVQSAQEAITLLTKCIQTKDTLTPGSGIRQSVDPDTMDILRVTLTDSNGDIRQIPGMSLQDLDFYRPNWRNEAAGRPEVWAWDASAYSIYLIPRADSDNRVTDGLNIYGVHRPATMSTDADFPFDASTHMIPYHMVIPHYVVAHCLMDNGDPASLAQSRFHMSHDMNRPGEVERYIKMINATFDSPTDIPAQIKWAPQGGLLGGGKWPTKSNPLV